MLNEQLILRSLALRTQTAGADDFPIAPAQIDNGDEALYADKSGTYTKGVLQSGIGLVDLAAYQYVNPVGRGGRAEFSAGPGSHLQRTLQHIAHEVGWHYCNHIQSVKLCDWFALRQASPQFCTRDSLDRLPNDPKLRQRAAEFLRQQGKEDLAREVEARGQ